ncbi:cysteine desulfurase family protein [Alteribacillus sp. HJP-4]|uniref:cysteine desulfurase family protein n=1 Tax=Alteribacillus sp. HJP-4 TaxID=2775394 RepID=UPI0035CD3B2A
MIYLDNSATTRPWPEVLTSYVQAAEQYFGNPSSLHSEGSAAETLLSKARESIASLLHVAPEEILFTSGGTEGNNLAIQGTAFQLKNRGRHLITTAVEHPSVENVFRHLEKEGFDVTTVPVDRNGRVDPAEVEKALRPDTTLVSVVHVNSEIGTIQPVEEIAERLRKYPKVIFHSDHVQGVAKVPFSPVRARPDLFTISAHKFHGLKGMGVLYRRKGIKLSPLFHGGLQEDGTRPGTENAAGAASMAKALRMAAERYKQDIQTMEQLKEEGMNQLETIEGVKMNTPADGSAPHIINFSIPGVKPEVVIQALAKKEMYAATKSACSSKLNEPSPVLTAAGCEPELAESSIRISMTYDTSRDEMQRFTEALKEIVPDLRKVMGANKHGNKI